MGPSLAIHPGALGDVLLAIPALRALRSFAPPAPLVLAAQPRIGALLLALGVVDAHHAFDDLRLDALFVDDPTEAPRLPPVGRLVSWFGVRDPVFVRRLRERVPDAIVAPSVGEGCVWEHLLATVGAPPGAWRDPVAVPPALRGAGRALLSAAGWDGARRLIVIHPGAGGRAKRWPAEAFAEVLRALASRHEVEIVVHEGPADREAAEALSAHLGAPARRLREPPLADLAGALTHAAAFLGNDSGVTHLAAAVGALSVALYSEANLAWRPWPPAACVVTVVTERVRRVDVDAVADAVRRLVG